MDCLPLQTNHFDILLAKIHIYLQIKCRLFFAVCIFTLILKPGYVIASEQLNQYIGPADLVVGKNSDFLYVLAKDARCICKLKIQDDALIPIDRLPLNFAPERLRISTDKKYLAVVGGGPLGRAVLIDLETFSPAANIPVGHTPCDIAVFVPHQSDIPAKDQPILYVANRFNGTISVVNLIRDTTTRKLNGFDKTIKTIPVGREPIALALSDDGKTLAVVNHLPEDPAMQFNIAARIRLIDTQTEQTTVVRLFPGAMGLRDIALSLDGRYAFVTGMLGNFEHLTDSVGGGWMNENHLYVIDLEQKNLAGSHILDQYAIGSANPWGISRSDDGRFLVVLAAGSSDVILLDLQRLVDMYDGFTGRTPGSAQPAALQDQLLPVNLRIPVGLKGVRHAVMSRNRVYASSYFEDAIVRVIPILKQPYQVMPGVLPYDDLEIPRSSDKPFIKNLRPDTTTEIRLNIKRQRNARSPFDPIAIAVSQEPDIMPFIPLSTFAISNGVRFERSFARLAEEPSWTLQRYGEMLFHDATLCEEHWQSCSTCHPDARADALNWDLLNDGADNPKNTKSLLLSHETPPSMATGIRERAEIAVRKGFETILMVPATEEEAQAVDAYLMSLKSVPSSKLVFDRTHPTEPGRLSDAARRGKRIFNSDRAGCSLCHPEPLFTDMRLHNVNTRAIRETRSAYDTPTLVEIWRTSPYLHDGRYSTIKELLIDGKHFGKQPGIPETEQPTEQELADLLEYILSL